MSKQKNLFRIIINFYLAILIFLFSPVILAAKANQPHTIRIAILDNFTIEKSSHKYKDDYFDGVSTATMAAREKGFIIQHKTFTYGSHPLDILAAIPEVQDWKPDFIIGPHSSNQFLLLDKYFKNILVLSPYATDEDITKMPSNFYSLSLPDSFIAKAMLSYMEKYFHGANIFNIAQADCKDCVDLTNIFNELYKTKFPKATIADSFYIGNDVKNLNLEKLMAGYQKGDVIILQPLSHGDANILMPRISNFLKQKNITFIYNLDNWGNCKTAKKSLSKDDIDYTSIRVSPYIQNRNSEIFEDFITHYQRQFNAYPQNAVSYMSYASVMSVINALVLFPHRNLDHKSAVLSSFKSAHLKKIETGIVQNHLYHTN